VPADPICGMDVENKNDAITTKLGEKQYFFCSNYCLDKFIEPQKQYQKLKLLLIFSISLTVPTILFTYLPIFPMQFNHYLLFLLATPVQFIAGKRFYVGLHDSIKHKTTNMDVLISVGTSTAWIYSVIVTFAPEFFPFDHVYFETSIVIITLILTGNLMEHRTKVKAEKAVRKLFELQPQTAHVIRNGKEEEIHIEQISVGEKIIVRPGEKIPTDGTIEKGSSFINQSAITGESIPVLKERGDEVIGGTISTDGFLEIVATNVGKDTVLSNLIKLVEEAKNSKIPLQRIVDKISKFFVPTIITIAVFSGFFWYLVGDIGLNFSLLAFISVIIIACPCAIGIATPAAIMIGSSKAAENGILIKGGENLEIARRIDTIIFDKTGTLTKGNVVVTDLISFGDFGDSEVLRLAAIAEQGSTHPLAKAVVKYAKEKGIPSIYPDEFRIETGLGIVAKFEDHSVMVGNPQMFQQKNLHIPFDNMILQKNTFGKTLLYVAFDSVLIGAIFLQDELKDHASDTIKILKNKNIEVILVTGDNKTTADSIGSELGIKKIFHDVLPADKAKIIMELQNQGKIVSMVGDGINDAPALASADVGIAIGSGTEVAKETGGIVLIGDDLRNVVVALDLAKKTSTKIKQNLGWAFGYNTALVPIAAGILVPFFGQEMYSFLPFLAAGAMAFSDATVIGNSLLLNRYKNPFQK